jgi:hypothetical protein
MTEAPDIRAELEEEYEAHAKYMAERLGDVRTSLSAARTTVRKTLLDLGKIHDDECGGDCCLGYTDRTSVVRFLEDADQFIAAARSLLRLETAP